MIFQIFKQSDMAHYPRRIIPKTNTTTLFDLAKPSYKSRFDCHRKTPITGAIQL